ncbi:hypothetical protein NC797_02885 [Aquibacillus sp. 3ASR75-11]|uniref:DUF4276 family protein n=1 Tax=Terrihalobacillus insolitus TaxID=2950438 RepID=A0A9X3WT98_9BACI|nr:hypothetical protein [Terrihalobacillus insolitus]MDC3411870.1 hypothetical protein [Terrihalobacillus insolitus]MDC3423451.1 hypothetical protein [Terrihalobacillus insolitus]
MRDYQIGIVSEGPRDFDMLNEIIIHMLGENVRFLPLQPDLSATPGFGSFGAGWHGVRDWCQSIAEQGGLELLVNGVQGLDLLIIQLDGDVAREPDVNCFKGCPPAEDTVKELENWLLSYLKQPLPNKVIFIIPMDNLEAWVLAAYHKQHQLAPLHFECMNKPDELLTQSPYKLLKRKNNGKPNKTAKKYRDSLIPLVIEMWSDVTATCSQADKLDKNIKALMV